MWKDPHHLVNEHPSPHIFAYLGARTFKLYFLRIFQLHNIVSLITVTMFYIRFLDLIYIIARSFYPFISLSPFLPALQALETTFPLSVSASLFFYISTSKRHHTLFVFLWIILLSIMSPRFTPAAANDRIDLFFLTVE